MTRNIISRAIGRDTASSISGLGRKVSYLPIVDFSSCCHKNPSKVTIVAIKEPIHNYFWIKCGHWSDIKLSIFKHMCQRHHVDVNHSSIHSFMIHSGNHLRLSTQGLLDRMINDNDLSQFSSTLISQSIFQIEREIGFSSMQQPCITTLFLYFQVMWRPRPLSSYTSV